MSTIESIAEVAPALADFAPVCKDLENLSVSVNQIYSNLKLESDEKGQTLESLRREMLKANTLSNELKDEYNMSLGLDFVSESEAKPLVEVAQVRQKVATPYLEAYNLEVVSNRILRAVRDSLADPAVAAAESIHAEVSECRRSLHVMFYSLPDLGMTFHEWNSLEESVRKEMRPAGRPGMPVECRIEKNQKEMDALMARIKTESGGQLETVEQAIEGVALSNRGRPSISPLAALDRKLINLRKDLESVKNAPEEAIDPTPKPGRQKATKQQKIAKILNSIEAIEASIANAESELRGVEVLRRKLEKLRITHRDLAMMESSVTGREQVTLLMDILKNEDKQIDTINKIYAMDPEANETSTHQVNPKHTRERINRLKLHGKLREGQLEIVNQLEDKLRSTKVMRAR